MSSNPNPALLPNRDEIVRRQLEAITKYLRENVWPKPKEGK